MDSIAEALLAIRLADAGPPTTTATTIETATASSSSAPTITDATGEGPSSAPEMPATNPNPEDLLENVFGQGVVKDATYNQDGFLLDPCGPPCPNEAETSAAGACRGAHGGG
ncbi:hypothetical protein BT96DRAFT_999644 [Gymnopus androsaceus JB14]|uniref:Uncharacterized protein n=1 Tax=Gymnopus androsaceus JB14 TaxID=1447944 RepID=A0A6A4H7P0_9AGAR|nr:hypothetical protein BT96DRAFT_999644 [Gymnopus androsaceus JB14]